MRYTNAFVLAFTSIASFAAGAHASVVFNTQALGQAEFTGYILSGVPQEQAPPFALAQISEVTPMNEGNSDATGNALSQGFAVGAVFNPVGPLGDAGTLVNASSNSVGSSSPIGSSFHNNTAVAAIRITNTSGTENSPFPPTPFILTFTINYTVSASVLGQDPLRDSGFAEASAFIEATNLSTLGDSLGRFVYPFGNTADAGDSGITGEIAVAPGQSVSIRVLVLTAGAAQSIPDPTTLPLLAVAPALLMRPGRRRI